MPWAFLSDRPIYTQLIQHLRRAIAAGDYIPGSQLPTVRDLAAEAGVNPNTVQRAFLALELEGLIHAQRTTGRFVTEDVQIIQAARQALAAEEMAQFLSAMGQLGYSAEEAVALLIQREQKHATKEEF